MLRCMRTTLSLDEDVAAQLDRLRKSRGESLKALVNEALRRGLKQMLTRNRQRKPFRTAAVELGRCRIGNLDNVSEALSVGEGESFK